MGSDYCMVFFWGKGFTVSNDTDLFIGDFNIKGLNSSVPGHDITYLSLSLGTY